VARRAGRYQERRRLRTVSVLILLVALVGGGVYLAANYLTTTQALVRERCMAVVGTETYELDPGQAANAALISGISVQRGLPARAASIALATAIQESKLRNIDFGDMDSIGLFQQRPSQGWGTEEQIMDPVYSASRFYDALAEVGGYEALPITEAAQIVQRSAFPDAYADHEGEGRAFASALTGHSPASLNCVLRKAKEPGDPAQVQAAFSQVFGPLPAAAEGGTLRIEAADTLGWAAAQWAVANAKALNVEAVSFAGLQWNRDDGGWSSAGTTDGTVLVTVASAE
jgi:hypothetical protein